MWIPIKESSATAGEKLIKLEATLYKPEGKGPFPIVIFSHGSTGRRGMSEGIYDEPEYCGPGPAAQGIDNAITDTDAVVAYVKTLPFVDSSRILLSGISRGGFLSIIYASKQPKGVFGVVNFVGGWLGDKCPGKFNQQSFESAGATLRIPALWL